MSDKSVLVAVEGVPYQADIMYEYSLPEELEDTVEIGSLVSCPFGKGSRSVNAVVTDIIPRSEGKRLKSISDVHSSVAVLDKGGIGLCRFIKERYFCTFFEAAKLVMPAGTVSGFDHVFSLCGEIDDTELSEYFKSRKKPVLRKTLLHDLGQDAYYRALKLVRKGELKEELRARQTVSDSTVKTVELTDKAEAYAEKCRNKPSVNNGKHLSAIEWLQKQGKSTVKELTYMTGVSASVIKTLEKYGVVKVYDAETFRNPLKDKKPCAEKKENKLNESQKKAADEIAARFGSGSAHLLYGVTGSGKTHVFLDLTDRILAQGKSVLMLIPEISLTLQIIDSFYARYGNALAVLHSGLSLGERYDEYKRIRSGEARVVVGTRSAVFAPLQNLGLIIIDEEQEHTYKSEMSPKYSARTVAGYIVNQQKALLLLASATPSFESYYRAQHEKIGISVLEERFNGKPLPKVIVADMSRELHAGGHSLIGTVLASEIAENIRKKEQIILFMNRRGYNSFVQCPKCKYVFTCDSCGIPLTYHAKNNRLVCHYCGSGMPAPDICPVCGAETLKYSGCGTQKIEEELHTYFPELRVLRMDADTVTGKNSRDEILSAFANKEYDVLLGTQMITKGLNFPDVTLVGVLMADSSLYSSDFRAYEKTFSLITQVVGRAGRASKSGRAVIQTYSPSHLVLEHAIKQDYTGFYEEEASLRKILLYPPFCDLCQCVFLADSLSRAFEGAKAFIEKTEKELEKEEFSSLPISIIYPRQTAVPKVNGRDRVRILIKCKDNAVTRKLLNTVYLDFLKNKEFKDITVGVDMDPSVIV